MRRVIRFVTPVAVAACLLVPAAACADDASTLTVVGTSDVSDSGLMAHVIKPGFEAAFPQYTLNYVPLGTGPAITSAESGADSALIVHAASLENQFVAQGYSAEPFGRAIFWGDYVLLGPARDPAGIFTDTPHDIVTAFERIAQAGASADPNTHADFVSRGGTPGTTVAEHLIWALTNGVTTCDVAAGSGGGKTPSTAAGACPQSPPTWYHTTGVSQALNVENADVCAYNAPSDCYVLTDRGTFQFLASENPSPLHDLHIVTRDNSPAARGGTVALVNSFHMYAIDPAKFAGNGSVQLNLPAAKSLLDWITSPAGQASVKAWLGESGDPPFLPDSAPAMTTSQVPSVSPAGKPVTVTGKISNVVPGTPPLANEPVTLNGVVDPKVGTVGPVASAVTGADGSFSLTFTPLRHSSYTVSTGLLSQIEDATLTPLFGDLLAPTSSSVGTMDVQGAVTVSSVHPAYRQAVVSGTVAPGAGDGKATVTISGGAAARAPLTDLKTVTLPAGTSTFAVPVALSPGSHVVMASFADDGVVLPAQTPLVKVDVPGAAAVGITHVGVKAGKLTVLGKLTLAPIGTAGKIELLAHRATTLTRPKARARSAATVVLPPILTAPAKAGKRLFTLHTKLRRGYRWQIEIKYVNKGHADTAFSRLRTVTVR